MTEELQPFREALVVSAQPVLIGPPCGGEMRKDTSILQAMN